MRCIPASLAVAALLAFASNSSAQQPPAPPPVWAPPAPAPYYGPPGAWAPPGYAPVPYAMPPGYAPPAAYVPLAEHPARGTERRSTVMMITGFSIAGLGVTSLVLGSVVYTMAAAPVQYDMMCFQAPCGDTIPPSSSRGKAGGIGMMIAGSALVAVGLPIGIYGATKKPREVSPVPRVAIGPAAANLRWTF